jgi:alpha-1,3-mannosyltransferase
MRTLPYQVFAGWNGIAIMRPDPFYPPYNVRFRRGKPTGLPSDYSTNEILKDEYECQASESSFISWDFWKYGFGRIAVVPGVHACYGKDDARMRGWVEWPEPDALSGFSERIEWEDE